MNNQTKEEYNLFKLFFSSLMIKTSKRQHEKLKKACVHD